MEEEKNSGDVLTIHLEWYGQKLEFWEKLAGRIVCASRARIVAGAQNTHPTKLTPTPGVLDGKCYMCNEIAFLSPYYYVVANKLIEMSHVTSIQQPAAPVPPHPPFHPALDSRFRYASGRETWDAELEQSVKGMNKPSHHRPINAAPMSRRKIPFER
ncbi:hypothetical protein ZHAS_00014746 [Anopheles sinensis]|uniref:Uncharacterized protein n=1 Tax=Anopheles sinensis TaxID=74873 RepID=A0A084W948_ANOSI|nr:hypothetical protein ZHAS_00014746 [Anopheles sinensis]